MSLRHLNESKLCHWICITPPLHELIYKSTHAINYQAAQKTTFTKLSNLKTTCKAFKAFYKQFQSISKSFSDGLLELSKKSNLYRTTISLFNVLSLSGLSTSNDWDLNGLTNIENEGSWGGLGKVFRLNLVWHQTPLQIMEVGDHMLLKKTLKQCQ